MSTSGTDDLVADLRAVGVVVTDVYDLVCTREIYAPALPVLVDWLSHLDARMPAGPDRDVMREGLVRALTVRQARPVAALEMIRQFRSPGADAGRLRWTLGNGLGVVADDTVLEDVIDLFTDRRWGADRQMLAEALGRSRDAWAVDALVSQLDDDDVNDHAVIALGKRTSLPTSARPGVEALAADPRAFVRKAAGRALRRFPG